MANPRFQYQTSLGTNWTPPRGNDPLARLDRKIQHVVETVRAGELWRELTARATDPDVAAALRRQIHVAVASCRPNAMEASGTALEPLSKDRPGGPATVVCGIWWVLARRPDTFAYLGALYAFEALLALLRTLGDDSPGEERIDRCGARRLLGDELSRHPQGIDSIETGIDCLEQVFPLPILETVLERAFGTTRS